MEEKNWTLKKICAFIITPEDSSSEFRSDNYKAELNCGFSYLGASKTIFWVIIGIVVGLCVARLQ